MAPKCDKGVAVTLLRVSVPENFKHTEIGPVPSDWEVVPLQAIGKIITGKTPPTKDKSYWNGPIPFITPVDLQGGPIRRTARTITKAGLKVSKALPKGTVVVSCIGYIGKVGVIDSPVAVTNQQINAVIVNNTIGDNWYLAYTLMHLEPILNSRARVTTVPILNKSNFQRILIPLPPLPEQRAIAYVLRTVQRAKEATERVITALKELKKSLMKHLFTYGPVPLDQADQVPLKETEIGPVPEHWNVVQLGEILKLRKGTIHPDEVPNARYVGLEHLDSGEIWIRRSGKASDTKSAKAVFKTGDILYGKLRPYLDKAALAEWDGVCSTDILVLTPQDDFDAVFVAYLIHSSFVLAHAVATTTGVNHPRTSWKALKQAAIPLPPLEEQHEIARILQTVDRKIEAEEARKEALNDLFRSLLHYLMTAKMRVSKELVDRFEKEEGL